MGKWEMVRLGDVGESFIGLTYKPENIVDDGIIVLRSGNVQNNAIDLTNIVRVDKAPKNKLLVRDGDILMCSRNGSANLVGKSSIINNLPEAMTFGAFMMIYRSKSNSYITHFFHSPYFKRQLTKSATTTINQITKSMLDEVVVPLPPLDEQKRIAKNLDLASEIVKGYKVQLAELDKLVQSVFYEMFGESKTNPMQWETKKLGKIGKVGSSKRVFTEELVKSGIPFYRGTEIGALATKRDINIEYFIAEKHYNELCKASGKPAIGDLLMPSICNDGRIWRVDNDKPFYFKDGRVLWVHFSEQDSDNVYIQFALRERLISDYSNIASGTTFAELKIFALKNVDIMLPPLPLQTRFASIVTAIETQKTQVQQALTEAENLFHSLMQEYFE